MFFVPTERTTTKPPECSFSLINNVLWKTSGCKDIYNFYSHFLGVVDKYFVEFTT